MKILLTGSTGQVGHALLSTLEKLDGVTLLAPTRAELDLSQPQHLRDAVHALQPALIINPAAYTAVDLAEQQGELADAVNAQAPAALAQAAKDLGIGLIHYSTDYVYDGNKRAADGSLPPYLEQDATGPVNAYGRSKLAGELAIQASGCEHIILRTSWVYSMFGKNFLKTMLRLAQERDELRVVNDQWGTPTWAGWIAQATTAIVRQWQASADRQQWWAKHSGVYHLTSQGYTTWQGFAEEIMRQAGASGMLGKPAPVVHGIPSSDYPTPAARPTNSCLDNSRLMQAFGLDLPDWRTALLSCLQAG